MTKVYQYFMSHCIVVLIDCASRLSPGAPLTWFALFLIIRLNNKPWSVHLNNTISVDPPTDAVCNSNRTVMVCFVYTAQLPNFV